MLTVIDCPDIAGANSPIFNIAGAKATIASVLNRPLIGHYILPSDLSSALISSYRWWMMLTLVSKASTHLEWE